MIWQRLASRLENQYQKIVWLCIILLPFSLFLIVLSTIVGIVIIVNPGNIPRLVGFGFIAFVVAISILLSIFFVARGSNQEEDEI